jgi:hypothetical protein
VFLFFNAQKFPFLVYEFLVGRSNIMYVTKIGQLEEGKRQSQAPHQNRTVGKGASDNLKHLQIEIPSAPPLDPTQAPYFPQLLKI